MEGGGKINRSERCVYKASTALASQQVSSISSLTRRLHGDTQPRKAGRNAQRELFLARLVWNHANRAPISEEHREIEFASAMWLECRKFTRGRRMFTSVNSKRSENLEMGRAAEPRHANQGPGIEKRQLGLSFACTRDLS